MQDPTPLPWGTQDRYQVHFIVRGDPGQNVNDFVARTILTTKGHFGSKDVVKVRWNGPGMLAKILNEDSQLNEQIAKQSVKDATIFIDPTDNGIRIYGKWKNHFELGTFKRDLFKIYDAIAGHIKSL